MSSTKSTERLFSRATFEGLRLIRRYLSKRPDISIGNLLVHIEKLEPDGLNLDLEASTHLHRIVDQNCNLDGGVFYRSCIQAIVLNDKPEWAGTMRQGRKQFVQNLDKNHRDIFRLAGLMDDPPLWEVVTWWDMMTGHSRLKIDLEKMCQAREAERLTIEYEKSKLISMGIEEEPVWVGLDDNFVGYDVLSYDLDGNKVVEQMIEVKSTIVSPLRFILSRNEWDAALRHRDMYKFYVWDMGRKTSEPFILQSKQVEPHIPSDNGKGKWRNAEIPVSIGSF